MNKQGVLNEFLDISAGSGTHAPRQRQAYASKRLQQVVSDFRKQQKSVSVTPASRSPSQAPSGDESTGNNREPEPPASKKRKTKGRQPARGRGAGGRGNRTSNCKPRKDSSAQSDGEDEFVLPQHGPEEVVKERELRPRVKPRPTYRAAREKRGSALVSDD